MTIRDRLRELRAREQITQQELSDNTKIPRSTIAMYEAGKRTPNFEELDTLADYFNVSFNYLQGKTDINVGYPRHGDDPAYGLRGTEKYDVIFESVPADASVDHLRAYAEVFNAYEKASPEIQQAVRRILQMEG